MKHHPWRDNSPFAIDDDNDDDISPEHTRLIKTIFHQKSNKNKTKTTGGPSIQQYLGRTSAVVRCLNANQQQSAQAQQVAMTRRNCWWRLPAAELSVQSLSPHWWRTWGWRCCWSRHRRSSSACSTASHDPGSCCSWCRPSPHPSPQRRLKATTRSVRRRQSSAYLRFSELKFERKEKKRRPVQGKN